MSLPTRCLSIDEAMEGGFKMGKLSEVCGENGVGKTQLCLQTVATAIANVDVGGLGGSAIYISCMNPFPTQRLQQLLAVFPPSSDQNVNLVERVTVRRGSTPEELCELLNEVDLLLKAEDVAQRKYKVVVVDTIYGFITHHFPDTEAGLAERNNVVRSTGYAMNRMAAKYNVAFIATNHAVNLYGGAHLNGFMTSGRRVKPGVGLQWDKYLYIRYILAKERLPRDGSMTRTFQILDKGQCYARCRFSISDEGVSSA